MYEDVHKRLMVRYTHPYLRFGSNVPTQYYKKLYSHCRCSQ